jgi:hypothetical protein
MIKNKEYQAEATQERPHPKLLKAALSRYSSFLKIILLLKTKNF